MTEININNKDITELKNLANSKRSKLKYRTISSFINGEYKFKVGGIGNKSIKLEIFLDYETILANKEAGGIEETVYNKLMELPKPKINGDKE